MSAVSDQRPSPPVATSATGEFPLFYRKPQVLTAQQDGALRVRKEGHFQFAAQALSVPLMTTEFVHAVRSYPIVFPTGCDLPVAVLGLQQNNLFVDQEGKWTRGHYIPTYPRRYPFVLVSQPQGRGFALAIDTSSDRVVSSGQDTDSFALFSEGKPTEFTRQALQLCGSYHAEHSITTSFCKALSEQNLLIDNQAQALLPGGRRFSVQGFRIVDRGRFAALPDSTVAEWHRKDWLALINLHLASLERWKDLLDLQAARGPATT